MDGVQLPSPLSRGSIVATGPGPLGLGGSDRPGGSRIVRELATSTSSLSIEDGVSNRRLSRTGSNFGGLLTPTQERIGALLRCVRRSTREYETTRRKAFEDVDESKILDATTRPSAEVEKNLKGAEAALSAFRDRRAKAMEDEVEFGTAAASNNNGEFDTWGDDLDPRASAEKDLHPLVGGESLEVLMNPETVAADAKVLQKAFLWPTIEQPSAAKLVYAKDALRMYTLAARRIRQLQISVVQVDAQQRLARSRGEEVEPCPVTVPELTFVALVQDEGGHGYRRATKARSDQQTTLSG